MISHNEIKDLVSELGLREDILEKDYLIGWLLWGIGSDDGLSKSWIFKGGTCLKKCYIETYRFSEDLDFTILPGGPVTPDEVSPIIERLLTRVTDVSGIDFSVQAPRFRARPTPGSTEGRIYYRGPRNSPSPGSIKFDLTNQEPLIRPPVIRPIAHRYSDALPAPGSVRCYAFEELFAEKIRAMAERARPRDLYDIVNLFRRPDLQAEPSLIRSILIEKCKGKAIAVPTLQEIEGSPHRAELESEWSNMLAHQLPALPPIEPFWGELVSLFAWLEERLEPIKLSPIPLQGDESTIWKPSPTAWTLGAGVPLEVVRFAAANRLCIEVVYRNEEGQVNTRVVEPYSLRRTSAGRTLLHVVRSDIRQPRSYRVDRIQKVRVTNKPFTPVYAIELSPTGPLSIPPASRQPRTSLGVSRTHLGRAPRSTSLRPGKPYGITYVYQCSACFKQFKRSMQNSSMRSHKNAIGMPCYGGTGFLINTIYGS